MLLLILKYTFNVELSQQGLKLITIGDNTLIICKV